MRKKQKLILIIAIAVLFILLIIIVAISSSLNPTDNTIEQNSVQTNNNQIKEDEAFVKKLKKSSESERIRLYLGKYFKYIETKDYESAYNLLYPDFKTNYFPTLEDFKSYLQKEKFPDIPDIQYINIYLRGTYYIVDITIVDLLNSGYKKSGNYIVQENDYNNYYISFQI